LVGTNFLAFGYAAYYIDFCNTNNCGFNFPPKKEFQPNGLFETITLPIKESQKIPIKLVDYIYPKNWNEENDYVPFHNVYYIKRHLITYCT
jgi:hypothetical protein